MECSDLEYSLFVKNIKKSIGIDLSLYKESQMKRRLTSFRDKKNFSSFQDFFIALEKDKQLYIEFLDRITINVSEFFRNSIRWKVLEEKVIPLLLDGDKKTIKCWSTACSTGEEPYTLSMILNNAFPKIIVDIIATDIDETVLNKAFEGIYTDRSLREIPSTYKNKYFQENNGLFYVIPEIKKNIRFKKHDLLSNEYEGKFDLIICRNVMIYFTEEAKLIVYKKLSDSLRPGGVLFVGSTEQIFNPNQLSLSSLDNFFYFKN